VVENRQSAINTFVVENRQSAINTSMVDNIIKLFSYENRMDLMYVDSQLRSCEVTNNSPLNKKIFKIHKGVDNQIRFRVLNPDRKRVSVDHLSIRARFINTENQERVLDRFADLVPNNERRHSTHDL
jgi:hypothetical protein